MPTIVPTNASRSSTGGGLGGIGGAFDAATETTGGGGRRREAEKIGRSPVVDSAASGMAQSGLPLISSRLM
ncbi:hypothetical protein GCM10007857_13250 [Bradyrhizobium iriomotense]|uniref:Uncharacterized protein n=1 Tax=Bradyrhizobium iriomotense TaxID=441950 RepID=A0ABQ6AT58_9BRAD|nr:hypothetical protein GCM10007857_13250 [Bradyrhizobium iriomotense]